MAFQQHLSTSLMAEEADLQATRFIDSEHPAVREFVASVVGSESDVGAIAKLLFAAVRDKIRYDPYSVSADPSHYKASAVLGAGSAYCVPKAVLLTAAARAAGVPSRLGFADVRNHLQTERLRALMKTDIFVYHGYSTLFVGGQWLKASPAFNRDLCIKFGVTPLEFDGYEDALLHAYSGDGNRYMEYIRDHGVRNDLPFEELISVYSRTYPALLDGQADSLVDWS